MHLSTPKISLSEALKNAQKCKEKEVLYAQFIIYFTKPSQHSSGWRRTEDVFKASWKTKKCYAEDAFNTSWNTRNVFWLQSRGATAGTFDGVPKDALSDNHRDAREGTYEGCTKGCTLGCTWVSSMDAIVDIMSNAQMCTKCFMKQWTWCCTRRYTWWWT